MSFRRHLPGILPMRLQRIFGLCVLIIVSQGLGRSVPAFEKETRIPLVGCRQYSAAYGAAKLYEIRRVTKEKDREELVIEINNVPLPPGTVLVVDVDKEQIGKITLNSKRSGRLKLTSEFRKYIPSITPGTSVTVTTIEGRLVMR